MPQKSLSFFAQLKAAFPQVSFRVKEPLSKHTYFKIGGPAEIYVDLSDLSVLSQVASYCRIHHIPLTVLGGGSNVLVNDKGIKGLTIKNTASQIRIEGTHINVESGANMNLLVRSTIDKGLKGLECFMGLPGSVGGAIINNSHYKTQLFGSSVVSVAVIDANGDKKTYLHDELEFSYDHSLLQKTHDIVLTAELELQEGDREELNTVALEATQYRSATQPLGVPSSGCIFKNVEIPEHLRDQFEGKATIGAGWLIDHAGLKGLQVGDAVVSDKHANFIVNTRNASARDILTLSDMIEKKVFKKYGLKLHREVFVI